MKLFKDKYEKAFIKLEKHIENVIKGKENLNHFEAARETPFYWGGSQEDKEQFVERFGEKFLELFIKLFEESTKKIRPGAVYYFFEHYAAVKMFSATRFHELHNQMVVQYMNNVKEYVDEDSYYYLGSYLKEVAQLLEENDARTSERYEFSFYLFKFVRDYIERKRFNYSNSDLPCFEAKPDACSELFALYQDILSDCPWLMQTLAMQSFLVDALCDEGRGITQNDMRLALMLLPHITDEQRQDKLKTHLTNQLKDTIKIYRDMGEESKALYIHLADALRVAAEYRFAFDDPFVEVSEPQTVFSGHGKELSALHVSFDRAAPKEPLNVIFTTVSSRMNNSYGEKRQLESKVFVTTDTPNDLEGSYGEAGEKLAQKLGQSKRSLQHII